MPIRPGVLVGLLLLAILVAIGGVLYYRAEAAAVYANAAGNVELIAQLKRRELEAWRMERIGDGKVLASRNSQSAAIARYLSGRSDLPTDAALRQWVGTYIDAYEYYDRVFLVDRDGAVRLSVPDLGEPPDAALTRGVQDAIRTREVRLVDFYLEAADGHPHLGLVAPVLDPANGNAAVGAMVLRINPTKVLYPILEIEQDTSFAIKTVLVRRDGDRVLLLSPLPLERTPALSLYTPVTDADRLAAKAARGDVGHVRGVDYRNEGALGFITHVSGSPWILVTHVGTSELKSQLRGHLFLVTAGVFLLVVSAGTSLSLVRHQQRVRALAQRVELTSRLTESEERLRLALSSASMGLFDIQLPLRRTVVSAEYATMLGYDPEGFVETLDTWLARLHPADRDAIDRSLQDYLAGRVPNYRVECRMRTREGGWKWILSVGQVVTRDASGQPKRMIGTHTDITARKRAELSAERLSKLYLTLSRCNEAIVRAGSVDELFDQVCEAAVESGGFDMAWIGVVEPTSGVIRRVTARGTQREYLDGLVLDINSDSMAGEEPFARAIRQNAPLWFDDVEKAAIESPLKERVRHFGWVGMAAVPLSRDGRPIGALGIYSLTAGVFDADARRLLIEMAADISFALDAFARDAQREDAEARLRLSEARYRTLFAESGVPMLLVDRCCGRISDANLAAARFYGWDVATLRQMHIGEIDGSSHPDSGIGRSLPSGREHFAAQHVLATGERRDVEVFAADLVVDDKPRTLAIVSDVTARNAAEAALIEKEFQLTEAQRIARIGNWTRDAAGKGVWSDEMFRLFGLPDGSPVPTREQMLAMMAPEDAEAVRYTLQAQQRGESVAEVEFRVTPPGGRTRYLVEHGERRTGPGGVAYTAGTVQDVTERRLAEEALRIKDRAIESSLNAVAIEDLDNRITYVNPAFLDMWEMTSAEQALGRPLSSFWTEPDAVAAVAASSRDRGAWSGELCSVTQTGRHLDLLVSVSVVGDERRQPVGSVAAFVDITGRKIAEQAMTTSLREKEALLKEVHHRVKNNLQVISSLLRLELGRTTEGSVKLVLSEMQNRIVSMALLHETLYRSGDLSRVDLAGYLGRLVQQLFRSVAPASGRIALHVALEPAFVDLEQAVPCGLLLTELLSNSLKHGFPDNRSGDVQVTLTSVNGGPTLRLSVTDTGIGLPANLDARRSQSLGLILVSDLARQLRGTLEIGRGPGAAFTLVFAPLRTAPQRRHAEARSIR